VLERVVGDLELPDAVSVVAAANPPEMSAGGWDPSPPLANRFCHIGNDHRRVNATVLVADGVDLETAQVRLGHSDPLLTLAIYAQATSEADRDAANRIAKRVLGC
jgi:integrase